MTSCYSGLPSAASDDEGGDEFSDSGGIPGGDSSAVLGTSSGPASSGGADSAGAETGFDVDTGPSSSGGATSFDAPDMGTPVSEPSVEFCGSLNARPPVVYDVFTERYGSPYGFTVGDREYAAHTYTHGLSIVDVTEEPLVEVGHLSLDGAVAGRNIAGYGHTVYIGGDRGEVATLRIADVSDPANPKMVDDTGLYHEEIHTIAVYDARLYLNSGSGICRIFSLENPGDPDLVGAYLGTDCHDVYAAGNRLIVSGGYDEKWDIVDLSDPTFPMVVGVTEPQFGIYAHSGAVDKSGRYFLGIEEFNFDDMLIYDLSDPSSPVLAASYSFGSDVIPHNGSIRGDYYYIAAYEAGFILLDIHDPTAPVEVARMPTWPDPPAAEYSGAFDLDLRLPSGKVLVSDTREGLFVFCVQTPP